ncbi:xylulokinase [Dyella caseinilytica]|uniref:Xylulose kinase n=1 Tax=Dyella caseinilytica TaxID=1849581 RepID=A0ABX7GYS2_9GAMM|nr:xylulokinase [Dyella caseinilytica]QRN55660.1 xylulokinase [Dyella caseinilytica]GGA03507.1 xylulokinase [Dyella caseinilytica]
MFLGIDLGTSAVKAVLVDETGTVQATASHALPISHPEPRWSEQDPEDWWQAAQSSIEQLLNAAKAQDISPRRIAAIGLSGQMHGATVLDKADRVLRPAILWNDGRSDAQCREMEAWPDFRETTGNLAMPGFTAPKLLWLREHEPAIFERIAKVLLPKDYLRLRLTGEYGTDVSDAAGTLWLNIKERRWSQSMLDACGLPQEAMPSLHEGSAVSGHLSASLAERWGMRRVPVAAGGGDNAAGAVGVGIVRHGQAMLSLGTSGVYFAVSDGYRARPEDAVHSFCHALPDTWHLMSVMLNAASCLDFTASLGGYPDVAAMLADAERVGLRHDGPIFLPYLSGERTPHNDVHACGAFTGLRVDSTRADLANATLEGVGLGLLDGIEAVDATGLQVDDITVIGGGSRSAYWMQMLADIIGRPLTLRVGGEVGAALGAARLAHLAAEPGANIDEVCRMPDIVAVREPDASRHAYLRERRQPKFRALYRQLAAMYRADDAQA